MGSPVKVPTVGSEKGSGSSGPSAGRREAAMDYLVGQVGLKEACSD